MSKAMNLRKAESRSLADGLGGEKGIEYLAQDVVRNSDAGILHTNYDLFEFRVVMRRNGDGAALRHRVAGIDDQVDQGRFEFGGVRDNRPDGVVDVDLQTDGATETAVEDIAQRHEPLGDVDRLRTDVLPAREGQQLARQ